MGNLAAATREELIAIIAALMARVAELEGENRRLRGGKGGGTAMAAQLVAIQTWVRRTAAIPTARRRLHCLISASTAIIRTLEG